MAGRRSSVNNGIQRSWLAGAYPMLLATAIPGGAIYLQEVGPFLRTLIYLVALALAVAAMRKALS
jgi:hypothetical protein